MRQHLLAAAMSAAALPPAVALAATVQPEAGYYRALIYIAAASPECAALGEAKGDSTNGVFYYPGAGKTGATLRIPEPKAQQIGIEILPKTPAPGVTTWQGISKVGFAGDAPSADLAFKAKITYLDSQSFAAVFKATVSLGASTCKVTENIALIKTGN